MEALQAELKAAKEKWGKEIELSKADKGAPGFPFPVCCTRYTPQPEAAMAWDCEELPVRLVIHEGDAAAKKVSVEVPPIFPGELSEKIEQAVEKEWKKMLGKSKAGEVWMVGKIFDWIEAKFGDLLRLVPAYVDSYVGCDAMGASMRRYCFTGPAPDGGSDDEDDEAVDEEEQQRRIEEYAEREAARIEAEIEEKFKADDEKRKLAEKGIHEDGEKVKQLSKKEQAELNLSRKDRSGARWRKTGSKSHKPVREDGDKALKGLPGQKKK